MLPDARDLRMVTRPHSGHWQWVAPSRQSSCGATLASAKARRSAVNRCLNIPPSEACLLTYTGRRAAGILLDPRRVRSVNRVSAQFAGKAAGIGVVGSVPVVLCPSLVPS